MAFQKELLYYRTSLAGSLASKLDTELLIVATESYNLSIYQVTSNLHLHASLVCSLFGTLFTGKFASVVSYASCLFKVFTNSMHVFFNLFMLASLHARMQPGSTGRFFMSAVLFGSAAFNLLTIGSLLFSTPCRAAVSIYTDNNTINLSKGADGFYSAADVPQSSDLSANINDLVDNSIKGRFFSRKNVLYTIGLVTVVGLLWGVHYHYHFTDDHYFVDGVRVKLPRGRHARDLWWYGNWLDSLEKERFYKVGVLRESFIRDSVTGRLPVCYYYKQSFLSDFKDSYLAFHGLAPGTPIDCRRALMKLSMPGAEASFWYAWRMKPMMSFNDPTNLIVNLLEGRIYLGMGMGPERRFY